MLMSLHGSNTFVVRFGDNNLSTGLIADNSNEITAGHAEF